MVCCALGDTPLWSINKKANLFLYTCIYFFWWAYTHLRVAQHHNLQTLPIALMSAKSWSGFFLQDCCLIVFQPYRPLIEYCSELNEEAILPLAWRIVNDSLRTDVALLYPPYLIALGKLLGHMRWNGLWFLDWQLCAHSYFERLKSMVPVGSLLHDQSLRAL